MTYRLEIWYAATKDGDPQVHSGLSAMQVVDFVRPEVGFMHDLLLLEGRGVHKIAISAEVDRS